MKPFLEQVARHYHPSENLGRVCFVFPNKRAVSFFKKHLGAVCAEKGEACFAPVCLTVNDFFASLGGLRPADRIASLTVLYDCYRRLYPDAGNLDDFVFWGGVMLGDFAEVDKYLVNPEHIFKNVADFRRLQDDMDYLEPRQREAMESFLRQFAAGGDYKERFLRIWDILLPLYGSFNEALAEKGLATEGMIYRSIAERLDSESVRDVLSAAFPDVDKFIFTGLNALNECEKKVMRKMRDAHVAEFCWDYSSDEIKDPANRSSFFMSRNIEEFPQAFIPDPDGLGRPEVKVISCPSATGQTKLLPSILGEIAGGKDADLSSIGMDTAIVLPEESLLLNVLNSIPEGISDVNVTMGYPLRGSEFQSLLDDIAAMQNNVREKDGRKLFYHRYVWSIFSNSIIRSVLGEGEKETVSRIRRESRYYIDESSFGKEGILALVFRNADDPAAYLRELLTGLAPLLKENGDMYMELDFAMYAYKAATRLQGLNLPVQPRTWWRLFSQLTGSSSVPFNGEPLKGLQIMGPLETRALDFSNVVILSCNEGVFPRRSVSPSFIPAELRKGFGLPTYEYQDAVWAYYFYRLIQRASRLWLAFDSRTEMSRSGEESRYIRQLQMLYDFKPERLVVRAPLRAETGNPPIPKTEEDLAVMHGSDFRLSASALQDYLNCPAKFYYSKVRALRPADEVEESLDAGALGNVLHKTMQRLYDNKAFISREFLESLLGDKDSIRALIARKIQEELHTDEVEGRNLLFEDIIFKYVLQILRTDLALLKKKKLERFRILGLETERWTDIGGFAFKGIIDRLDSFEPGVIRVVDYKTGKVTDNDIKIGKDNAAKVVDKLFGERNSDRPKIALQLFLYDMMTRKDAERNNAQICNCIYQTGSLFRSLPESIPQSPEFSRLMMERLPELLQELDDMSVPWTRTEDADTCKHCDFKSICGR